MPKLIYKLTLIELCKLILYLPFVVEASPDQMLSMINPHLVLPSDILVFPRQS